MSVFHAEFASFHQLILVNATAVHSSHPHEQHVAHCPLAYGLIQVSG